MKNERDKKFQPVEVAIVRMKMMIRGASQLGPLSADIMSGTEEEKISLQVIMRQEPLF